MGSVNKVLVVGGGPSGMSLAICLRRAEVEVDLVDRDPQWLPVGAGLSLNGASLRAFQRVGVLEQLRSEGHLHSGFDLLDLNGRLLHSVSPPSDPNGVPGGGGILRPVLHQILAEETRRLGTQIRLGVSIAWLHDPDSPARDVGAQSSIARLTSIVCRCSWTRITRRGSIRSLAMRCTCSCWSTFRTIPACLRSSGWSCWDSG